MLDTKLTLKDLKIEQSMRLRCLMNFEYRGKIKKETGGQNRTARDETVVAPATGEREKSVRATVDCSARTLHTTSRHIAAFILSII